MDEWMDRWTDFVVMTIVYVVFPFLWVSGLSDLAGTLVIASLHLLLVCFPRPGLHDIIFPFSAMLSLGSRDGCRNGQFSSFTWTSFIFIFIFFLLSIFKVFIFFLFGAVVCF